MNEICEKCGKEIITGAVTHLFACQCVDPKPVKRQYYIQCSSCEYLHLVEQPPHQEVQEVKFCPYCGKRLGSDIGGLCGVGGARA